MVKAKPKIPYILLSLWLVLGSFGITIFAIWELATNPDSVFLVAMVSALAVVTVAAYITLFRHITPDGITITKNEIIIRIGMIGTERKYLLTELDGYIEQITPAQSGPTMILFLIQDQKRIGRINQRHYSNFEELVQALADLKQLEKEIVTLSGSVKSVPVNGLHN